MEEPVDTVPEPIPTNTTTAEASSASHSAPTIREIVAFAIPAMGVWLCSPLLSMIDTSTVGLFAGTAQQAALNPATALTDYSARLFSFLYTGTTSLMASSQEQDTKPLMGALQLSILTGVGLCLFLQVFGKAALRSMIGNESLNPQVLSAATRYMRIRALGMPAAAFMGTAQAACLGLKDVQSPLQVIVVASVMNLILDLALVGHTNAWIGGTAGAAWATIASQYLAVGLFGSWLFRKRPEHKTRATTRGLLHGQSLWKTVHPMKQLRPFVLPVTTTQVGRCSTYVAMNHVVSSSLGTVSMAAHQILMSVFYTLIPIADSLSLTAQALLPKVRPLRPALKNLLIAAVGCGGLLAAIVLGLPWSVFSADPQVLSTLHQLVPLLTGISLWHGVFCAAEGVLLSMGDLTFLGRWYAVFFAIVPWALAKVPHVGLWSVWGSFGIYQACRVTLWVSRVAFLERKQQRSQRQPEVHSVAIN